MNHTQFLPGLRCQEFKDQPSGREYLFNPQVRDEVTSGVTSWDPPCAKLDCSTDEESAQILRKVRNPDIQTLICCGHVALQMNIDI